MFTTYLHIKLHILSSSDSIVIAIKQEVKCKLTFYIIQNTS